MWFFRPCHQQLQRLSVSCHDGDNCLPHTGVSAQPGLFREELQSRSQVPTPEPLKWQWPIVQDLLGTKMAPTPWTNPPDTLIWGKWNTGRTRACSCLVSQWMITYLTMTQFACCLHWPHVSSTPALEINQSVKMSYLLTRSLAKHTTASTFEDMLALARVNKLKYILLEVFNLTSMEGDENSHHKSYIIHTDQFLLSSITTTKQQSLILPHCGCPPLFKWELKSILDLSAFELQYFPMKNAQKVHKNPEFCEW
jgi:hypothetical protein